LVFCDAFFFLRKEKFIYKTLNSWGDTKEGKNLSKKKNGFVVLTLVHLIIHHHGESVAGRLESAVRHAARVRRAFAADEDDDDDDDVDCFSSSSSLFCFPFLLAARSCIIIFIVFRLSLFSSRVRLSSNRVRRVVLSLVFLWRGARRGQNRASSGGGDALLGWAFEETRAF
jgi:GT2 family glycosyltransferase